MFVETCALFLQPVITPIDDIATTAANVTVSDSQMADGSDIVEVFNKEDIPNSNVTVDGERVMYVAKIGNTYYETLADAVAAADQL